MSRDQILLLKLVFVAALIVIIILNIIAIFFYFSVSKRLRQIEDHSMTQRLSRVLDKHRSEPGAYTQNAKKVLQMRLDVVKNNAGAFRIDTSGLAQVDASKIQLPSIDKLADELKNNSNQDNKEPKKDSRPSENLKAVESEVSLIKDQLKPLDSLATYRKGVTQKFDQITAEMQRSLNSFDSQFASIGNELIKKQVEIKNGLDAKLSFMNQYIAQIRQSRKLEKMGIYYKADINSKVDTNLNFSTPTKNDFIAEFLKPISFTLPTNRFYFCTFEANFNSVRNSSFNLELIDQKRPGSPLFETGTLNAKANQDLSYSKLVWFKLETGDHELVLRARSPAQGETRASNSQMTCVSHRIIV